MSQLRIVTISVDELADLLDERVEKALNKQLDFLHDLYRVKSTPTYLNLKEASKLLKISQPTLRNWIKKKNDLPFSKTGRNYSFDKEKLLEWFGQDWSNKRMRRAI